ncbi:MAG TPA: hypothetical protein VGP94_10870, partial [Tepidisphaeraceae bacterium]|nr:hypothetical protein [Tepidisphaeraceae bacterium]
MKRVLVADGSSLRSTRIGGARGIYSFQELDSFEEAKAYLQEYASDAVSMLELRRALAEEGIAHEIWQMSDAEVIDQVAWNIQWMHFEIAEELEEPLPEIPEPEDIAPTAPPELPRSK